MNKKQLLKIEIDLMQMSGYAYSAFDELLSRNIEKHIIEKDKMQEIHDQLIDYLHKLK